MGSVGGLHSKSRGRPYAVMILVAFGAAMLGVMLLHKFRERRICNLLLKRTDQDLHSFQLLFQRERDRSKELEKNSEDMKATLYTLRTQKMELDRRLLELLSSIDSLRDEQKTMNVALKEKKKEIKVLRDRELESGNEKSQVVALTQSLRQKEAELEVLRRQFESRGDVATDEPTEQNEQLPESSGGKGGETNEATDSRDGTQKDEETPERREMKGEERQKQESMEDEGEKKEAVDGEVRKVEGEESKIAKDQKEEEAKDSRAVENQRADKILKSGMKMETETGKYGRTRKIKGKRWRYIAKKRTVDNGWRLISKKRKQEINRNLDENGVIGMGHRKFFEGGASNAEKMEYPNEARENQTEKERQVLNSMKGDILREDGEQKQNDKEQSGDGEEGDGNIEQNPSDKMELKDLKSEEKQDADGRFNKESNSDVREEEEENKEETEESEF